VAAWGRGSQPQEKTFLKIESVPAAPQPESHGTGSLRAAVVVNVVFGRLERSHRQAHGLRARREGNRLKSPSENSG
jgi:hypothetical protein